jgi:hypothetical protein
MFPIVRVDSRNAEALEQLGTKRKFWYDDGGRRMLLKLEERGTGEDWAEKLACELCELLGLPHVHYDLALDMAGDIPAVICETCAPPPMRMGLGNQLLQALDPTYPQGIKYHVREHTVDAVADVIGYIGLPPAAYCQRMPAEMKSALDVFTGYVMLDAWIANQDRHHENWAALLDQGQTHLAPTFDHGASMARNLQDAERAERLASRDRGRQVPAFASRARSAFYADAGQTRAMTTIAAWQAFSRKASSAANIWLERLGAISAAAVQDLIDQVPPQRMSQVARDFTRQLLAENQRRLLAGES